MQVVLDDYVHGAAFATELVNTSPKVWVVAGERLTDPCSLQSFLNDNHVRADDPPEARDLAQIRSLREKLREILDAPSAAVLVDLTHDLLSAVPHHIELVELDNDEWRWHAITDLAVAGSLAEELAIFVGYALLGTVRTLGFERFRSCASPTCNGVFVDVSRGGRRRYCMPELCGNRINVANHRQRKQAHGTG